MLRLWLLDLSSLHAMLPSFPWGVGLLADWLHAMVDTGSPPTSGERKARRHLLRLELEQELCQLRQDNALLKVQVEAASLSKVPQRLGVVEQKLDQLIRLVSATASGSQVRYGEAFSAATPSTMASSCETPLKSLVQGYGASPATEMFDIASVGSDRTVMPDDDPSVLPEVKFALFSSLSEQVDTPRSFAQDGAPVDAAGFSDNSDTVHMPAFGIRPLSLELAVGCAEPLDASMLCRSCDSPARYKGDETAEWNDNDCVTRPLFPDVEVCQTSLSDDASCSDTVVQLLSEPHAQLQDPPVADAAKSGAPIIVVSLESMLRDPLPPAVDQQASSLVAAIETQGGSQCQVSNCDAAQRLEAERAIAEYHADYIRCTHELQLRCDYRYYHFCSECESKVPPEAFYACDTCEYFNCKNCFATIGLKQRSLVENH